MKTNSSLAKYAVSDTNTLGRVISESKPSHRSEFQRDRDRIIHSAAFRRLEYKTQVFVNHEGDLFRTRLTHSIEVAQIARSISRYLNLNEDLAEAVALAHDLGHTPFGHAGQDVLNTCMKDFGGFEHNLQSLRVVDVLEEHYAAFNGLNLCHETREGILKHCSVKNAKKMGIIGERFIEKLRPSLEAQVVDFSDAIAYGNHDVDDGLRSGLITLEQLCEVPLVASHLADVRQKFPNLDERRTVHEMVRRMIGTLVNDLLEQTKLNTSQYDLQTLDDVHNAPALVGFSPAMDIQQKELKRFLNIHLYHHYRVVRMCNKGKKIIEKLFDAFMNDKKILPTNMQSHDIKDHARVVADYIAGMTDRYAVIEYKRIFSVDEM
jgi:dGTPase